MMLWSILYTPAMSINNSEFTEMLKFMAAADLELPKVNASVLL